MRPHRGHGRACSPGLNSRKARASSALCVEPCFTSGTQKGRRQLRSPCYAGLTPVTPHRRPQPPPGTRPPPTTRFVLSPSVRPRVCAFVCMCVRECVWSDAVSSHHVLETYVFRAHVRFQDDGQTCFCHSPPYGPLTPGMFPIKQIRRWGGGERAGPGPGEQEVGRLLGFLLFAPHWELKTQQHRNASGTGRREADEACSPGRGAESTHCLATRRHPMLR